MAIADTKTVYVTTTVSHEVPMDRFDIQFGYKDRSSIQIRLESDGSIYLCDHREDRWPDRIISAGVPFEVLAEAWPGFVTHLAALGAAKKTANLTDG